MRCPGRDVCVTRVQQRTADNVRLVGLLLQPKQSRDTTAVVVGHGFTNHVRKPFVTRILRRLAARHTVIAFDFRGHGRSGGRSTAGPAEVRDLSAAVALARRLGHRRVATVGFSMGGAVALLQAATDARHRPDAVISVSAAARWSTRDTAAMRRLLWLAEVPPGRVAMRTLGVRLAQPAPTLTPSPIEVVQRIPPTPLLLVHGDGDHYVTVDHPTGLYRATGGNADLWLVRGMRHAETAMTPDLVDRMSDWLAHHCDMNTNESEHTAA